MSTIDIRLQDTAALDLMAGYLRGNDEWGLDMLDAIVMLIEATGRQVFAQPSNEGDN